jgi:hypothetical protein
VSDFQLGVESLLGAIAAVLVIIAAIAGLYGIWKK